MNKEELKELAATLNGIADGKAWEFEGLQENWHVGDLAKHNPHRLAADGWTVRLKPWSLPPPPEGMQWHRDDWTEEMLPDGYRPLLEGEPRISGDQFFFTPYGEPSEWIDCGGPPATPNSSYSEWCHHRTKRPIPQPPQPDPYEELKAAHAAGKVIQQNSMFNGAWVDDNNPIWNLCVVQYRIKPEQQKVPLEPSDVPPGSAITAIPGALGYCFPVVVDEDGCYFASRDDGQDKTVSWEAMADGWQINRSLPLTGKWNPEAWEPCYKLIDTP